MSGYSPGLQRVAWLFTTTSPAFRRFVRYAIVGSSGAILNVSILYVLTHYAGWWYVISSVVAFSIAVSATFFFQKFWAFKEHTRDQTHLQWFYFFAINGTNLLLNTLILYLCVEWFGLWYVAAQLCTSAILSCESFFAYRAIFRTRLA